MDNQPTDNRMKAGAAVAIMFSLGGDQGLQVFDPGYPASQQVSCSNGDRIDDIAHHRGPVGLSYNSTTGVCTYVWKTDKSWANSCRLIVKLTNGTAYYADFRNVK